ncbi:MAG: hypothetical protein ACI856_001633, partial [Kiritimatiellia bacterium]
VTVALRTWSCVMHVLRGILGMIVQGFIEAH